MKKLVVLFACLFSLLTVAHADDDKPIQVTQLPQVAQKFLKQLFTGNNIAMAKLEKDFLDKKYEVIFTNGDKVEFDKKGNWKEVDCKYSVVPAEIISAKIQKYVTTNYPDIKILKIDRDKKDYEIELSNGLELKFDLAFNLINIEH